MKSSMPTNAVAKTVGHIRLASDCADFIETSVGARKWRARAVLGIEGTRLLSLRVLPQGERKTMRRSRGRVRRTPILLAPDYNRQLGSFTDLRVPHSHFAVGYLAYQTPMPTYGKIEGMTMFLKKWSPTSARSRRTSRIAWRGRCWRSSADPRNW